MPVLNGLVHDVLACYARRRFGEGVAEMTEEEKRLGRLVKARAKQAKKASVFNLDSSAADGSSAGGGVQHELTHFGRVPAPALCSPATHCVCRHILSV